MYVIGDVHGCFDTLKALLDKVDMSKGVCFVGDLIDRGPRSKQVIQFVIDNKFDCVKGNHEDMACETDTNLWLYNGGVQTLNNYKIPVNKLHDIPIDSQLMYHLRWMKTLPVIKEYKFLGFDSLLVSHSSAANYINQNKRKDMEEDLMWGRNLNPEPVKGVYNVFGHTIQKDGPKIDKHFACIDTGCFYTRYEKTGFLTALEYPSLNIVQQKNID